MVYVCVALRKLSLSFSLSLSLFKVDVLGCYHTISKKKKRRFFFFFECFQRFVITLIRIAAVRFVIFFFSSTIRGTVLSAKQKKKRKNIRETSLHSIVIKFFLYSSFFFKLSMATSFSPSARRFRRCSKKRFTARKLVCYGRHCSRRFEPSSTVYSLASAIFLHRSFPFPTYGFCCPWLKLWALFQVV